MDDAALKTLPFQTNSAFTYSNCAFPCNRFPNKLGPKVPDNIVRNPPFCSFTSFLVVLPASFVRKADSSRDLIIFMILFIFSLEISSVKLREAKSEERPDPNNFLWIAACATDAPVVNPNVNPKHSLLKTI